MVYEICESMKIKVIALECDKDHTHMFLNAPPTLSPSNIMAKIKGVTDDGKVRFFGNGRQNKFKKRKFRSVRKKLAEKKKLNAIRKINNKEQRWMEDKDHKVSRAIVNFAIENKISVIRLERLANIRQTTRTSRKNEKNLHTWSFYRLSQFIEYKAKLEGIKVEYVNPAYTSQTCPKCSERNKAQDRKYKCKCGFEGHRDIIGAMNIRYVPVVDGKSQSA